MTETTPSPLNNVITIDDERIKNHLDRVVRGSVEETLNALLDAEADRLCNAQRYERSAARRDTRAGHYERNLQTKAGEVRLKVPKLRHQTFETAIIERYRRRESSVEEALIEMYLAGVSVRRVEDITEALWGMRVSPSTVSDLNQKIYGTIEAWRNRPIEGEHPYVYLDGIVLKRSWAGEVRNVSLLVAIAVNGEGYREILGICEGAKEDKAGWSAFLRHLKERGLSGVRLVISDACLGLAESAAEFFPEVAWQRCIVGSLKKWPIQPLYAAVSPTWPRVKTRAPARSEEGKRIARDNARENKRKESGCQPLEVYGGCRQVGLDLHVGEAATYSARKSMPCFGLAVEAFRTPTMALIEPSILFAPSLAAAAGAEQSRVVVANNNCLVDPPLR